MNINDSSGFFQEAISAIVAAVAGGVVWAIRNTYGRIRRLEDCTVRKKEFDEFEKSTVSKEMFVEHVERVETDRRELREGIIKLFDKLDEIKTILIRKNADG